MNLINYAALIWQRRRWFMLYYGSVIVLVAVLYFVKGHSWTAHASFAPQNRRAVGGLQGLAAQIGVSVPTGELTQSPLFYSDLLRSTVLLNDAVVTTYPERDAREKRTLIQILGASGDTPEQRRELTVRRLRTRMTILTNTKTGVVEFLVSMPDQLTSAAVAERLLELLNQFNLQSRQSNAAAERRFTETRVNEVGAALRAAEDAEQSFLQQNRDYRNSSQLSFQYDRLQRAVQLQQQLYNALAQSLEQAKIEEVRDTPVITVIERPLPPAFPDSRGIAVLGLTLLALGTMLGILAVVLRDRLTHGIWAREFVALTDRDTVTAV